MNPHRDAQYIYFSVLQPKDTAGTQVIIIEGADHVNKGPSHDYISYFAIKHASIVEENPFISTMQNAGGGVMEIENQHYKRDSVDLGPPTDGIIDFLQEYLSRFVTES